LRSAAILYTRPSLRVIGPTPAGSATATTNGVLFCGRPGAAVISAMCRVRMARNGLLQTIEVPALQAYLATGDWLVLADGYLPKKLSPLALPM